MNYVCVKNIRDDTFQESVISNIFDTNIVHIDTISVGHIDVILKVLRRSVMSNIFDTNSVHIDTI